MKALFVDFGGRKSKKNLEYLAQMAAAFGLTAIEAEVEQPIAKVEPAVESEPVAAVEEPEPAPDDTRLESKESQPRRRGRRKNFKKLPKETFPIESCLFVGMVVASTGRECGIAGVETNDEGKVRLAFIDKGGESASTECRWFVDPATIKDRMDATVENALMIKTVYN